MQAPMTASELQEVLRLHALWLVNEEGGKRANLSEADLREANLSWANLREANLSWANLREANLSWANLSEANLSEADLRGANLRGANLRWANLSEANLSWANLSEAENFILIGQDIRGYLFTATTNDDGVIVICTGCHRFTGIAAARAHWTARHVDDAILHEDCLSMVDRAERMARVRGWKLEIESEKVVN